MIKAIGLLLILVLSACGGSGSRVPVIERPQPKPLSAYRYVVNKGDTLYSIAWRYGLDFKQLAQANSIPAPYIIHPGQKIRLSDLKPTATKTNKVYAQAQKPSRKTTRLPSAKTKAKAKQKKTQNRPTVKTKKSVAPKRLPEYASSAKAIKWAWPINGKVIKTFSVSADKFRQGIDLSGRIGEPVKSAASGVVVYAGDKLPGYGKLVIIKHNAAFLSAYAHNRRIYVKEGQKVNLGEKIADMGRSGTSGAKLHFQIRQDGKPTNPLKLLPHRG